MIVTVPAPAHPPGPPLGVEPTHSNGLQSVGAPVQASVLVPAKVALVVSPEHPNVNVFEPHTPEPVPDHVGGPLVSAIVP